jgi:hypothetical protein
MQLRAALSRLPCSRAGIPAVTVLTVTLPCSRHTACKHIIPDSSLSIVPPACLPGTRAAHLTRVGKWYDQRSSEDAADATGVTWPSAHLTRLWKFFFKAGTGTTDRYGLAIKMGPMDQVGLTGCRVTVVCLLRGKRGARQLVGFGGCGANTAHPLPVAG